LTNICRFSRREALQALASKHKMPSRHVYACLEQAKKSVK
jgi:hypothetical protein